MFSLSEVECKTCADYKRNKSEHYMKAMDLLYAWLEHGKGPEKLVRLTKEHLENDKFTGYNVKMEILAEKKGQTD